MATHLEGTYLEDILAWHRRRAARSGCTGDPLLALARKAAESDATDPIRPFRARLEEPGVSLIAEVKRRSPKKGPLAPHLDPGGLACTYEAAGARCLSVLTDAPHFGGGPADLRAARASCGLPVLRKDFTVSEADVYETRLLGADAVLLIVAALSDEELASLMKCAEEVGLYAVVEVHDEQEAERSLLAGATILGVNQRDLRTFEVDKERAVRVAKMLPADATKIAESGIRTGEDVARLADAGYDAVLVGESLVTSPDPGAQVALLLRGGSERCG